MYATNTIIKHSKKAGKLIGTHQKVNKIARMQFVKINGKKAKFPGLKEIQYFEGTNGPDGLKRKSPGEEVPCAFLNPKNDDGRLARQIMDHHHNLVAALKKNDEIRASFEAAWMSHDVVDGLTPPHHYPFIEKKKELQDGREFLKVFGQKTQGLMPGDNFLEVLKNNWIYWGTDGLYTEHVAFEFGVAFVVAVTKDKALRRMPSKEELEDLEKKGFEEMFYRSVKRVAGLNMYERFLDQEWTTELALETKKILIPEIVKCVTMAWASAYWKATK